MSYELYVHGKSVRADGSSDSFWAVRVESRESPLGWQLHGLTYTASGYGRRIPTRHMVRFNGRWRRVYCCIFSNVGTWYIGKIGDHLRIEEYGS